MKRTQAGVLSVFACAMTMTLSAQSNPPGGAQTPPAGTPSARESASKVTVTGCLEKASASSSTSPTGTSGAATGAAMEPKFVLNQVTPSSTGTAGTAGTSTPAASSYKLDGDDAKLSPHVGHKVEITGSIDDKPSSARSETPPAASSSASAAPKLKVEAVKMIAGSCTP
jgi:hypothetical protein